MEDSQRHRQIEESLERERSLLASIMQATDVMLVYLDPDFNFVWVNASYAATCKMQPEEMVGKNHFVLYPHAENEMIFRRVRDTGEPAFYKDKPFEFPDQPERGLTYWDWSLVPVKEAAGQVRGLVFSLRETTRYKRAEQALRESEQRLRLFVEHTPAAVAMFDREMRYIVTSRRYLTDFRVSMDVIGKSHYAVFPELSERWKQIYQRCLAGAVEKCEEEQLFRQDGTTDWIRWEIHPWRDAVGELGGIILFSEIITERKRSEEARRETIALIEADQRKNEFLAMLSHELRNPLMPIRNSLFILDRVPAGDEQARRARAIIERQIGHMTRIIDDLLDVTRITRGKIQLQYERLDLNELVQRTVEDYRSIFIQGDITLEVRSAPAEVWVRGDRTRLAQVLGNLLQNAAKFTPEGGKTTTTLHADAATGQAILHVSDTGSGIAPEFVPRLFEIFAQADATLDRSKGGLGLGLALVKGLVEMHGGTVTAASGGIGKGATFTIRLPLEITASANKAAQKEGGATGGRRVLVIDDNVDAADSLKLLLEIAGHQVEVVYNGREGLTKARAWPPDVVLCDIGLPDIDGYEVARSMRVDPDLRHVVLAAVTGYAQPGDVAKALQAGFDAHVAKPPTMAAIEEVLAQGKASGEKPGQALRIPLPLPPRHGHG